MKRFLLLIFTLCNMCILSNSQEHISFKKAEMNCSASNYLQKLTNEGLILISTEHCTLQNIYTLKGTFASVENCIFKIYCQSNDQLVGKAVIIFPKTSWQETKENYNYLTSIYERKYDEPTAKQFYFISPYRSGDKKEFEAFQNHRAYAFEYWKELSAGLIKILINENGQIEITYEDRINWKIIQDYYTKEIETEI